ncbi:hypothetical protein BJ508DRAFT_314871 [Ascobolus immersus RN42]|uniref:Uncharacterized protein n=1 Tax=Ascobolus immersus RN42 TaxID=1160509 RepID=A0A3N4HDE5_ASCIM|nr:hypothetical protein BJ508DRAFT_314871 [Ascobolus immersus RN42]
MSTSSIKREDRQFSILSTPRKKSQAAPGTSEDFTAENPNDDDAVTEDFKLSQSEFDESEQPKAETYQQAVYNLQQALGTDNTELENHYWKYLETNDRKDGSPTTLLDAINYHSDYLRFCVRDAIRFADITANYASATQPKYEKLKHDYQQLQKQYGSIQTDLRDTECLHAKGITRLEDSKQEIERLTRYVKQLETTAKKTTITTSTDKDRDPSTLKIPKALQQPLQANPITAYSGSPDIDTIATTTYHSTSDTKTKTKIHNNAFNFSFFDQSL